MATPGRGVLGKYRCPIGPGTYHIAGCPFGHLKQNPHDAQLKTVPAGICVDNLFGCCIKRTNTVTTNGKQIQLCTTGYHPSNSDLENLDSYRKTVAQTGGDIDRRHKRQVTSTTTTTQTCVCCSIL